MTKTVSLPATVGLLGLVLGLNAPVEPASAEVLLKQEFQYFTVRGQTSREIFRDFQRRSPIPAKGLHDATLGVAAIKMTPNVLYLEQEGRCEVKSASVELDIVIHLPRWANYNSADEIAQRDWDVFVDRIRVHELEHVRIAQEYADRITKKIESFRPRRDCNTLEIALTSAAERLLVRHDRAQQRFDRREYRRLLGGRGS